MSQYFQRLMQRTGLETKKQSSSLRNVFRPLHSRSALTTLNAPGVVISGVGSLFSDYSEPKAGMTETKKLRDEASYIYEVPSARSSSSDSQATLRSHAGLTGDSDLQHPVDDRKAGSNTDSAPYVTDMKDDDSARDSAIEQNLIAGEAANETVPSPTIAADSGVSLLNRPVNASDSSAPIKNVDTAAFPESTYSEESASLTTTVDSGNWSEPEGVSIPVPTGNPANFENISEKTATFSAQSPGHAEADLPQTDSSQPDNSPDSTKASSPAALTNTFPDQPEQPVRKDFSNAHEMAHREESLSQASNSIPAETVTASQVHNTENSSVKPAASESETASSPLTADDQDSENIMHIDMDALAHEPGTSRFAMNTRVTPAATLSGFSETEHAPGHDSASANNTPEEAGQNDHNASESRTSFSFGGKKGSRWGETQTQGRQTFGKRSLSRHSFFKS